MWKINNHTNSYETPTSMINQPPNSFHLGGVHEDQTMKVSIAACFATTWPKSIPGKKLS